MSEPATKSVQTTITISNDADNDTVHVRCLRTCQTVTHIDIDEKSPDKINALLGFTPYSLIQEGAIKIYDIPKKNILRFDEEDDEDNYDVEVIRIPDLGSPEESAESELNVTEERISTEITGEKAVTRSNIKKPEVKLYKRRGGKKTSEMDTQTELMVAKHILSENELPAIHGNVDVQTSLTFSPNASDTVMEHAFEDGAKVTHRRLGSVGSSYGTTVSRFSFPKVVSTINASSSQSHRLMTEMMEATAKRIRETFSRMVGDDEFGELYEEALHDQEVQCDEFADHITSGDCRGLPGRKVLCECDCMNAGGAAVPLLNTHRHLSASLDDCVCLAQMPTENKTHYKSLSQPSLILNMKTQPHYCSCGTRSKSDALLKCAGFMADKTLKPQLTRRQDDKLLVDLDNDYADGYLEQLEQEQVGTQTDIYDLVLDDDVDGENYVEMDRCTCERNVEMPWDDITFMPLIKHHKKGPLKLTTEFVDEATDLQSIKDPSIHRLKQLGVTPMTPKELQNMTRDLIDDEIAPSDATRDQVKDNILDEEYGEFKNDSKTRNAQQKNKEDVEEEEESVKSRLPTPKAKRFLVYDPDCAKDNEPYLDRMHIQFPDDCDNLDPCPSHIEMPWTSIVLPQKPKIRREYKPLVLKKDDGKKVSAKKEGKKYGKYGGCMQQIKDSKNTIGIDIKLSFGEISSRLIPVENGARDQISISTTTISNVTYTPKRAEKSYIIKGSFSQPFLGQQANQSNKCICNTKGSDVVRVLNFSEPKGGSASDKAPHKKDKMKQIASLPSINNSNKTSERDKPTSKETDKIAELLNSCKKEMEPIKDGINKLRLRIRELNLPDIRSYQQEPTSGASGAPFNYTASFSALAGPSQLPYNANLPPCWTPFVPYPCALPPCWPYPPATPMVQPYKPRQKKRKTCPSLQKDDTLSVTPSSTQYDTEDTYQPDIFTQDVTKGYCSGTCGKSDCSPGAVKNNVLAEMLDNASMEYCGARDCLAVKKLLARNVDQKKEYLCMDGEANAGKKRAATLFSSPKEYINPPKGQSSKIFLAGNKSKFTMASVMGFTPGGSEKESQKQTEESSNIWKKESEVIAGISMDGLLSIKTEYSKQSKNTNESPSILTDPTGQSKVSKKTLLATPDTSEPSKASKVDSYPSKQSKVSKETDSKQSKVSKETDSKQSKVFKESSSAKPGSSKQSKIDEEAPNIPKKGCGTVNENNPPAKICEGKSRIPVPICKCTQNHMKRGTVIKTSDSDTPTLTYVLQTVTVKDNKVQQANTVNIAFRPNPYKKPVAEKGCLTTPCPCQAAEKKPGIEKRTCTTADAEEMQSTEESTDSSKYGDDFVCPCNDDECEADDDEECD